MPVISRIWARSALISAGLQPQQEKLEPGRLVSAIGLLILQCRPGRTTKTPRLQGNLSRRSRSYGHSMGVNTPARKSALGAWWPRFLGFWGGGRERPATRSVSMPAGSLVTVGPHCFGDGPQLVDVTTPASRRWVDCGQGDPLLALA
jgi:hypothetical protein